MHIKDQTLKVLRTFLPSPQSPEKSCMHAQSPLCLLHRSSRLPLMKGAVILVDVAESLLQQVPVAREVIGFLTSLHDKWKAWEFAEYL